MSLIGILQAGTTGMNASQSVLRTISNNIANVNTPGYARERVSLEALAYGTGQGGVKVASVDRVVDRFLEQSARTAAGDAAYSRVLADYHSRLQTSLGKPGDNNTLASQVDAVFASLQTLSLAPGDTVRRQDAIAKLDNLFSSASGLSDTIQSLRTDANSQLISTLGSVNDLLATLGDLNNRIVEQKAAGANINALVEQRNQALGQLSDLVDVEAREQTDGSTLISTRSGLVLLDKSIRRTFTPAAGSVAAESVFPAIDIRSINNVTGKEQETRQTLDENLLGGSVKALLDLRDRELQQTSNSLGQFVQTMADEFNRVHNGLSAVPPPSSLTGRNTGLLGTDRAAFSGKIVVAITDPAGVVIGKANVDLGTKPDIASIVTDINAQLGGSGLASLVNGVLNLSATGAGAGVLVTDDPANPSDRAGHGFSQFFGLNDLVTGVNPTSYATGVAVTDATQIGSGSFALTLRDSSNHVLASETITPAPGGNFASLLAQLNNPATLGRYASFSLDSAGQLVMTPQSAGRPVTLDVLSDSTTRGGTGIGITGFFGMGSARTAQAAKLLSVRDDIKSDPSKLGSAVFDIATAIGSQAVGAGDDRGANALRDIATKSIKFAAAGNLGGVTTSLTGYASALISDVSGRATRAIRSRDDTEALANAVAKQRDDYQGVNLDEELGNLVVFQNSYNAAARLITTARDMYDVLLSLVQ